MSSTVEIKGMDEVLAKLEAKFSKGRVSRIENNALRIAGRLMAVKLKQAVASYRDTGATVMEITVGNPKGGRTVRKISIGWSASGSGQRWRLVHLNEFGYTRWGRSYSPNGMGKIQGAFDSSKDAVKVLQRHELERLL